MNLKINMMIICFTIFIIPSLSFSQDNSSTEPNPLENTNNCFTVTSYNHPSWDTSIICNGTSLTTNADFHIQDRLDNSFFNNNDLQNLTLSTSKAANWLNTRDFILIGCTAFVVQDSKI